MSKFSSLLKKWSDSSLVLRILVGLAIGAVLGLLCPQWTGIGILGQVFVSALKAIAPVLVALLVASSIAKAKGGLGPRFRTVIILYLVSTLCAAIFAVVASFLFPVTIALQGTEAGGSAPGGLSDVFLTLLTNMVMNPVQALAQANYIGILFWAIILGFALKLLASERTIGGPSGSSATWRTWSRRLSAGSSSSRPSASWASCSPRFPRAAWKSSRTTGNSCSCWSAACAAPLLS